MTAQRVEPASYDDRRRDPSWLTMTVAEAAPVLGLARERVWQLAREGSIEAVKVDDVWLLDGDSVRSWRARNAEETRLRRVVVRMPRHVDAQPLLRQIELRGGDFAVGVRVGSAEKQALDRARARGTLAERAADQLAAHVLGMSFWELWPDVG